MTKEDLEALCHEHRVKYNTYEIKSHKISAAYELGYAEALDFILENLDDLYEETHQDYLMRRAIKEAMYRIREYFQNKYGYDDEWSADEIEDRIKRALDEGDAETIANSFIDSADDGIPNEEWCESIVRDFYD